MRRLGSTVCVIATAAQGQRFGFTATSVCPLAMEPPSILICANQNSTSYERFAESICFSVNILAAHQCEIADAFGGKRQELSQSQKFALGRATWVSGSKDVPLLTDGIATLLCERSRSITYGTHGILIGHVLSVQHERFEALPLMYSNGRYLSLRSGAEALAISVE